jgi:voltage-gated potassium channel
MPKSPSAKIERILDAAVVAGAFATIPLTLLLEQGWKGHWIRVTDWVVWSVFAAELVFKVLRRKVDCRHTLFLVTVVVLSFPALPALLGLARVARLVRVVRVSRFLRLVRIVGVTAWGIEGLRAVLGRKSMIYVGSISILVLLAGGGGIVLVEPETARGGFLDGVWWAIVTASTVGYGDIAPATPLGRAIAVVLMLTGVGLISTLAASITSYFLGQQENEELAEIKTLLTNIERILKRMQVEPAAESTISTGESTTPIAGSTTAGLPETSRTRQASRVPY